MARVEPTFGGADLADTAVASSGTRSGTRRSRPAASLKSWIYPGLLLAAIFIGVAWAAFHFGVIGQSEGAAPSVILPKALIFGGLGLVFFAQLLGVALLFGVSVVKGMLGFFVPGYWLFALRREGMYWGVVGMLMLGFVVYALGIVLAS